jgi:hypothetical protein
MMIAQIGDNYDPDQIYILYGCNNAVVGFPSSSGFTINVSAGAVFYNGEVYNVSNTGVMVNSGVLSDFYFTPQTDPTKIFLNVNDYSDPVTFKNGIAKNILQTNTMTISEQLMSSYSDNKTRLRYAPHLSWNTVSTAIYMVDATDSVVNLPKIAVGDNLIIGMTGISGGSYAFWLDNVKILNVINAVAFGYDMMITLLSDSSSNHYYWRIDIISTSEPVGGSSATYYCDKAKTMTITAAESGTYAVSYVVS